LAFGPTLFNWVWISTFALFTIAALGTILCVVAVRTRTRRHLIATTGAVLAFAIPFFGILSIPFTDLLKWRIFDPYQPGVTGFLLGVLFGLTYCAIWFAVATKLRVTWRIAIVLSGLLPWLLAWKVAPHYLV